MKTAIKTTIKIIIAIPVAIICFYIVGFVTKIIVVGANELYKLHTEFINQTILYVGVGFLVCLGIAMVIMMFSTAGDY